VDAEACTDSAFCSSAEATPMGSFKEYRASPLAKAVAAGRRQFGDSLLEEELMFVMDEDGLEA